MSRAKRTRRVELRLSPREYDRLEAYLAAYGGTPATCLVNLLIAHDQAITAVAAYGEAEAAGRLWFGKFREVVKLLAKINGLVAGYDWSGDLPYLNDYRINRRGKLEYKMPKIDPD